MSIDSSVQESSLMFFPEKYSDKYDFFYLTLKQH